jgi:hypothetical protein
LSVRPCLVLSLVVIGPMAGCTCGTVIGEDLRFACEADPECGEDHRCFQGSCLRSDDPVFRVCVPELCDDGEDNDCDGKPDCEDSDCCSVCGTCELDCGDGADDDCDGLGDCAGPDCAGKSCGDGRVCGAGGTCECAGQGSAEVACGDGVDNDCDGLVDCADPDCLLRGCSPSLPGAICCSVGPSSTACRDLRSDKANCGGCGISCGNRNCVAVTVASGEVQGACSCTQTGHCRSDTVCTAGFCSCSSAAACAQGQTCGTSGLCAYPEAAR